MCNNAVFSALDSSLQLQSNPDLIEKEYITNLQKQVSLLQTEANYLYLLND
jgi:hypothetical protein